MSLFSGLRRGWRAVLIFIVLHLLAFAFLGWLAHTSSAEHPDLSIHGSRLRLVPLDER